MADTNEKSHAFAQAVLGQGPGADSWTALRTTGRQRLEATRLPTRKDEEWRFINLRELVGTELVSADQIDASVGQDMVDDYAFEEAAGRQLVFVNGRFAPELSSLEGFGDGVRAGHLADAGADADALAPHLGAVSDYYDHDYFAALNTAGFADGAYLVVPPDTAVDGLIHVLYVATESGQAYAVQPRNLFVVGQGSKATVVTDFIGPHRSAYLTNAVDEVRLAPNATLDHIKIQRDSHAAFHIGRTLVDVGRGAHYNSKTISLGAKLSRYDVYAAGNDLDIDCNLDGLAVLRDDQVSDTHTVMDHRMPHGGSHQLHKMVLADSAQAVFNGKIFVQENAQKIDAYQLNRTLLLSQKAQVNTKPQLEIFADDVKCTHGATVGQLDLDQLFYLKSRGLSDAEAREILVFAFAAEVIETVPVESVRKALQEAVRRRTSPTGA